MPDVSVYITLCDMLGISINEFFAGEDIREENYIQKSEQTSIVAGLFCIVNIQDLWVLRKLTVLKLQCCGKN